MCLDLDPDDTTYAEGELPLETVDLSSKRPSQDESKKQQPILEFKSDPAAPDGNSVGPEGAAPSGDLTRLQGTELRTRRTQSASGRATNIKEWSVHQIKITKQMVQERFGSGVRTVDTELEKRIESLKDTQKKYAQLIALGHQFQNTFTSVVETQKSMAEHFAFMSVRAPELTTQFHYNAETQKVISRNGETLLSAIKHFSSNLQTVSSKTMEDTLQTVKMYETARLSYDAYRTECDNLRKQAATSQKAANNLVTVSAEFEKHKAKFEQLRRDVDIKLKLLDENKVWQCTLLVILH